MLAQSCVGDPDRYIRDSLWAALQKLDGKHLVADGTMGSLRYYNRKGDRTDCPKLIARDLQTLLALDAVLDGELMANGTYVVFDLVACGSLVTPATPWSDRRLTLESLFDPHIWKPERVKLLPCARTTIRKRTLFKKVWTQGYEGVMLAKVDAPYRPAKSPYDRSPHSLKCKNVRTIDAVVKSLGTTKQNMQLEVYRDGEPVDIGECSRLEGDAPKAKAGDVIEIQVLNCGTPEKPRLYQPHAKRLRDDKDPNECTYDQLNGLWKKAVLL